MQRKHRNSPYITLLERAKKKSQSDNEIQHKGCLWPPSFSSAGDLVIVRGRPRVRQSLSENFMDGNLSEEY